MINAGELARELELEIISGSGGLETEVLGGYVSDLLSDVIGNAERGAAWITIQTHLNTIAVASLRELSAIIIAGGHQPESAAIDRSNIENIPLLTSRQDAFTVAGRLFNLLNRE
jgi:predicted transcriptional regulator